MLLKPILFPCHAMQAASLPQLVERMGRDPCDTVVDELVSLLLPNLLPEAAEPQERLHRCVFLMKLDPMAAMQFYSRARRHSKTPRPLLGLLQSLADWAKACVEERLEGKGEPDAAATGEEPPAKRQKTGTKKGKGAKAQDTAEVSCCPWAPKPHAPHCSLLRVKCRS